VSTAIYRTVFISWLSIFSVLLSIISSVSAGQNIILKVRSDGLNAARVWSKDAPDPGNPLAHSHDSAGAFAVSPLFSRSPREADPYFSEFNLHRYLLVHLSSFADANRSLALYRRHPSVEYAGLNTVYSIRNSPEDGDPLESEQWGLAAIRAREAWSIVRGSDSVPVAIIDTGVDYTHPDLAPSMWINETEDLNGNGRFDPFPTTEGGDCNGLDDDGNGYTDDVIGWDFTDAPELPGTGDWRERDNDPMDEGPQSHGTHVAGIACAAADNGEGIAGVAPGCRIMALRAGFGPVGYLQEDDVSSAIVYAVQNDASVINMSWGDVVVSPMIRDVLAYAHAHDCILVASAGNSGTDQLHYPSGYDYTISVGNSSMDDDLTPGSNYGPTIDVVAPGQRILSTLIGGTYGTLNGTSMSAPHVSGLAALIRSYRPTFTNEEVRHALTAGAIDLGAPGIDQYFGGGRIDCPNSISLERALSVEIDNPYTDAGIADDIAIEGTVRGLLLDWWALYYGEGRNPVVWHEIGSMHTEQAIQETLEVFTIDEVADGEYVIRLVAEDLNGVRNERRTPVEIDRSSPVFLSHSLTPVVDGPYGHFLLEFSTDDITTASVLIRSTAAVDQFIEYPLSYTTDEHRWLLGPDIPGYGEWEYQIRVTNIADISSIDNGDGEYYQITIDDSPGGELYLPSVPVDLPAGYLVPEATDYDGDGLKEITIGELVPSALTGESTLGSLRMFEIDSRWNATEVDIAPTKMYPLGVGDGDNDGLPEILGHYWARVPVPNSGDASDSTNIFVSYLWEPSEPGGFPHRVSWSDSGSNLALGMADADGDQWGEIYILNQDVYPRTSILVYEAFANDSYAVVDTIRHPLEISADFVLRTMASGDSDADGMHEVVFGDKKGRLVAFEARTSGGFDHAWTSSSSAGEAGVVEAVGMGDMDGIPGDEFVGLVRFDENLNLEHNFDSRRWFLTMGKYINSDVEMCSEIILMGVDTETALNGLRMGDLDGDEDCEVVVSVYPDCYIFDYDEQGDSLRMIWYVEGADTWTAIIDELDAPFPNSTGNELVLSYNDGTRIHSGNTGFTGPAPPSYIDIEPLESTTMLLRWPMIQDIDHFRLYRGQSSDALSPLADIQNNSYTDSGLAMNTAYYYAVSTVDLEEVDPEGPLGPVVSITTAPAPEFTAATFYPPYHVYLEFDQRLNVTSAKEPGHYRMDPGSVSPSSAVISHSETGVILSFPFLEGRAGSYVLRVNGVRGYSGIPVSSGESITVNFTEPDDHFYITDVVYSGSEWIEVGFNNPPDSTLGIEDVSIRPELAVYDLIRDSIDSRTIRIHVEYPEKINGTTYVLRIENVRDVYGNLIDQNGGGESGFNILADNLHNWYPVPNPWNRSTNSSNVRFFGSPQDAVISIYALNGRRIAKIKETDRNGVVEWDGTISGAGGTASPGVYICRITSSIGQKSERLVILR